MEFINEHVSEEDIEKHESIALKNHFGGSGMK